MTEIKLLGYPQEIAEEIEREIAVLFKDSEDGEGMVVTIVPGVSAKNLYGQREPYIEVAHIKGTKGAEIAKKLRQYLRVKRDIKVTPITLYIPADAGDE
ncbi:hypothetical protein KAW43_01920 [Candidatus Parcubacteria bacterium]|nr:hypothetical protein [Candidatus Parcubacteria bacterium]